MKTWLIEQQNNKPHFTDWQLGDFHDYCLAHPKAKFHLTPIESQRTLAQNAFYHVYLEIIARETGNDPDDLHEYFKEKLLPRKLVKIKGRNAEYDYQKLPSTTKLKKIEFGEYMDKICQLTGVPIPDPAEAGYFK